MGSRSEARLVSRLVHGADLRGVLHLPRGAGHGHGVWRGDDRRPVRRVARDPAAPSFARDRAGCRLRDPGGPGLAMAVRDVRDPAPAAGDHLRQAIFERFAEPVHPFEPDARSRGVQEPDEQVPWGPGRGAARIRLSGAPPAVAARGGADPADPAHRHRAGRLPPARGRCAHRRHGGRFARSRAACRRPLRDAVPLGAGQLDTGPALCASSPLRGVHGARRGAGGRGLARVATERHALGARRRIPARVPDPEPQLVRQAPERAGRLPRRADRSGAPPQRSGA